MTGYTPKNNLPYAQPADILSAWPATSQDLATKLDDIVGAPKVTELGNAVDLNTITATGLYGQSTNAEAATGINYPMPNAGLLEVFNVPSTTFCWQRYSVYAGAGLRHMVFNREFYSASWSPWARLDAHSVQSGSLSFGSVAGDSSVMVAVTFPYAFPVIPVVTISPYSTSPHARGCGAASISTTGFNAYFGNWGSSSVTGQAGWVARVPTV